MHISSKNPTQRRLANQQLTQVQELLWAGWTGKFGDPSESEGVRIESMRSASFNLPTTLEISKKHSLSLLSTASTKVDEASRRADHSTPLKIFFILFIIYAAALAGVETDYPASNPSNVVGGWTDDSRELSLSRFYRVLNLGVSAIFLAEILLRLLELKFNVVAFFRDALNAFDTAVVLLSLMPLQSIQIVFALR